MSTPQQVLANRANAEKSTGPRTPAGKQRSAQNSTAHGLTASSIEALSEANQAEFAALAAKLRQQLRPHGPAEEEIFAAYAWNTFQADRARAFEAHASAAYEAALLDDSPTQDTLLRRLDTLSKYRTRLERAASRSFRDLGLLQADRLAANETNALLKQSGANEPISPALPTSRLLNKPKRSNPFSLAQDHILGLGAPSSSMKTGIASHEKRKRGSSQSPFYNSIG
ncbi:MAG: hypothetical protein NW208_13985 [Bryobacter sp.]|nr:hypothetical protein [Bryobacter sp.]